MIPKERIFAMKKKVYLLLSLCLLLCTALTVSVAAVGGQEEEKDPFSILASAEPMVKGGLVGRKVSFAVSDFAQALGTADIKSITFVSLPDGRDGTLKLSGMNVSAGQTVRAEYLHLLSFVPANEEVKEASFGFSCGDYAGGSVINCHIRMTDKSNQAPTVTSPAKTSVTTQKGVAVYGTLVGTDEENDELTYIVTSYPQNGSLTVIDKNTGKFCYEPNDSYCGKDSFRYVIRDCYGNYSYEDTVKIEVAEKMIELDYADMAGHSAYNAALTAAANRWMIGTLSGDGMYFTPEGTVSRGDFVAMVMKAAGVQVQKNLTDTCFDDNDQIPASVRSYVATAQAKGYVIGSFEEDGLYFHAQRPVTRAEAAVIVNRILDLDMPTSAPVFSDADSIPVWASGAIAALFNAGIFEATEKGAAAIDPLTRADAVVMLSSVAESLS